MREYFDEEGVRRDIMEYRKALADPSLSCDCRPSDLLGRECLGLIERVMGSPSFRNYDDLTKDEMRSFAVVKLNRALQLYDAGRGCKAFSYLTRTVWLAFLTAIKRHYRYQAVKRDFQTRALLRFESEYGQTPITAKAQR